MNDAGPLPNSDDNEIACCSHSGNTRCSPTTSATWSLKYGDCIHFACSSCSAAGFDAAVDGCCDGDGDGDGAVFPRCLGGIPFPQLAAARSQTSTHPADVVRHEH